MVESSHGSQIYKECAVTSHMQQLHGYNLHTHSYTSSSDAIVGTMLFSLLLYTYTRHTDMISGVHV